ncbi:MAG: hypothetical protein GX254_01260 [Clostridiales bacterium]|nr:hypothetical protein [Clostridiales bacterium]
MSGHQFGILHDLDENKLYIEFEPEKYKSITKHDRNVDRIYKDCLSLDVYWAAKYRLNKRLAYHGVTIISPESLPPFKEVIARHNMQGEFDELIMIIDEAIKTNMHVINYGI